MRHKLWWLVGLTLLIATDVSVANVPASYFACEGSIDGNRCRMVGPFFGRCTLDTLCEDDEDDPSELIGNIYHETIAASFLSKIFINEVEI